MIVRISAPNFSCMRRTTGSCEARCLAWEAPAAGGREVFEAELEGGLAAPEEADDPFLPPPSTRNFSGRPAAELAACAALFRASPLRANSASAGAAATVTTNS